MAKTVGETGVLRITLVGAAAEKVTLPAWARSYSVLCESVATVRVGPGDDATAVEGSTSPAQYKNVVVTQFLTEPFPHAAGRARVASPSIWVYSAGAAEIVVSAYESVS